MDLKEATELTKGLLAVRHEPARVAELARGVYQGVLAKSRYMTIGNFGALAGDDLELMFDQYDGAFFEGRVRKLLKALACPISFHPSPRLTRSGGLTKQFRPPRTPPRPLGVGFRYEIALSSSLLFQTFRDVDRPVKVSGLMCKDRLEAAQRIMEHETIHLIEMLALGESSCSADQFRALAQGWFGHTETKHDLVTRNEVAREKYAVRVGDRVRFTHDGRALEGLVNRITQRATVLVEDPKGQLYTSGKRYLKFYVPLELLRKVEG